MKSTSHSGRPTHCRRIADAHKSTVFTPKGGSGTPIIEMGLDELEAIRLCDHDGLYQEQAAVEMGVSRQTLGRILKSARGKIAAALLDQKQLIIRGGNVEHRNQQGLGRGGSCICPSCETRIPHEAGKPCTQSRCPNCRKAMLREGSAHHQAYLERKKP